MSRFETTFRNAIANAERDVLVDQIRSNPQMSLSELGKLATGELGSLLRQITIGDLVAIAGSSARSAGPAAESGAQGGGSRGGRKAESAGRKPARGESVSKGGGEGGRKGGKAQASQASGQGAAKGAQAEVDTRTAEGRAAYDQAVLTALQAATGPQSASDLTRVAGGSPLQIRTALARLIETGSVHWSGRARGTRYTAA